MNITDLIVELLQQGKQVELPGMGTFGSEMQPPYHDPATGTYYPARRTLTFSNATSGDESIVQSLAQRECVGENVARQMWKNYVDALTDKLQRTGSHAFGDLGMLNYSAGGGYTFAATPGVVLTTGDEKPLEHVRTYSHEGEADPFAQFEDGGAAEAARQEAERAEAARVEAERQAAEAARQEAERAEAARVEAERQAAEAARREAERAEAARVEAERQAAEAARREAERAEAARLESERQAAEAARQEAKRAEAARQEAERKSEEEMMAALTALDPVEAVKGVLAEPDNAPGRQTGEKKEKKKRRFPWWILLVLLLLLLLGGAAYYYFKIYKPAHEQAPIAATVNHVGGVPAATDLSYNTDLLQYDRRDIEQNSGRLCRYMEDYIYSFLAYRHYAGAHGQMMERVRQYADERLATLMGDRFAIQRFIPFNDYIYNHNEPYLRRKFAAAQRVTVQSELLDMRTLDGILDRMVSELGLEPDAGAPRTAAPVAAAPAKQAPKPAQATAEEAPVRVNMEQESRQGFDIIAGFYIDRATAARLTARLHELGSDAYIIEKNNMYYVSMGSAKNRTAAEALFKHIKGWYDGDIAIKQW